MRKWLESLQEYTHGHLINKKTSIKNALLIIDKKDW